MVKITGEKCGGGRRGLFANTQPCVPAPSRDRICRTAGQMPPLPSGHPALTTLGKQSARVCFKGKQFLKNHQAYLPFSMLNTIMGCLGFFRTLDFSPEKKRHK